MSIQRIANVSSIPTVSIPGGKGQFQTKIGKFVYSNEHEKLSIGNRILEKFKEKLGRDPTPAEVQFGPNPRDDRNLQQKMERDSFRAKTDNNPHPMQSLADSLRDGVGEPDEYKGLSLRERLALDAERVVERDTVAAEEGEARAAKLAKIAKDTKRLDEIIEAEHWRAEKGSQRLADLAFMLKTQLQDGNDPAEVKRLRAEMREFMNARASVEREKKNTIIDALKREMARVEDGSEFADLEVEDIDSKIDELKAKELALQAEQAANDSRIAEIDQQIGSEYALTPEQSREAQMQAHSDRAKAAEQARQAEEAANRTPQAPIGTLQR